MKKKNIFNLFLYFWQTQECIKYTAVYFICSCTSDKTYVYLIYSCAFDKHRSILNIFLYFWQNLGIFNILVYFWQTHKHIHYITVLLTNTGVYSIYSWTSDKHRSIFNLLLDFWQTQYNYIVYLISRPTSSGRGWVSERGSQCIAIPTHLSLLYCTSTL